MLLERIETPGLAHYSYVVGCPGAGQVAVVDPRRDVDVYVEFAARRGLEIIAVLETHIHADYASGALELARRTGAPLHLSAYDAGERYEVSFPHRELREGERLELGSVCLQALHTPGHTPEHLAFLVYDRSRSEEVPLALLSGDFLFVGSLGRPDLLGEEAKKKLARQLFLSTRTRLADLPDGLEIYPAHGAGSLCGSGMSGRPLSTLGFERIANPYLDPTLDEETFVSRILASVPPFPPYYRRMKELNSVGPPLLGGLPGLQPLSPLAFAERVKAGHVVIDLRDQLAFGGGHIPGAFGIGAGPSLSVWASWVVPYDSPLLLVAEDSAPPEEAARALVRVGLDQLEGYLEGGIAAWREAGLPLEEIRQVSVHELQEVLQGGNGWTVLDVRSAQEFAGGHVGGARHLMAGEIPERLEELKKLPGPLALICGSGYRSTVAASLLARAGRRDILNVSGGMRAWTRAGLPLVRD